MERPDLETETDLQKFITKLSERELDHFGTLDAYFVEKYGKRAPKLMRWLKLTITAERRRREMGKDASITSMRLNRWKLPDLATAMRLVAVDTAIKDKPSREFWRAIRAVLIWHVASLLEAPEEVAEFIAHVQE